MINVAVIGFGFMGLTHVLNILKNRNLSLRAIITRNVNGVAEKLQEQVGNFSSGEVDADTILKIPVFGTLRECLKHEKLDAVQICVHTDMHYELAMEAMENGLHVFLEKPMSLRPEECRLLIAFAKDQNLKLMVGHVVRFMPPYRKLKDWVDNNEFGSLKFISLTRLTGLPVWGQWKEKQRKFGSSGGALFDLLIHDIDFLNFVLGPPGKIEATSYPGALSMHDYVVAHWQYRAIKAKVEGGNIFHSSFPFQAGYIARFENATIVYSSLKPEVIQICTDEKVSEVPAGNAMQGFYDEIDYFASCIERNTEPLMCTPASSLKTIELCYDHL